MQSLEQRDGPRRGRVSKSDAASSHRQKSSHESSHEKSSILEIAKMGGRLPRTLKRNMETHPEAVLATVGGASFLAGVIFGSRVCRAVLSAAIPFGLQYLVESEFGPRLLSYVEGLVQDADPGAAPG
jgi:hypothetical protein